jgi:rubrerythrin
MKKNPYEPLCEFLDDAIEDEAEGIAHYEEFRKAAERAGLVTLTQYVEQIMYDEQEHLATMLAFRKNLCAKKK